TANSSSAPTTARSTRRSSRRSRTAGTTRPLASSKSSAPRLRDSREAADRAMAGATGVRRRAFVDLDIIRSNATTAATAPLPDCTADLRADAYGHGLIPVARALTDAEVGGFLVSRVEDAAAIADEGLSAPVEVGSAAGRPLLGPELFGLDPTHPTAPAMRLEG